MTNYRYYPEHERISLAVEAFNYFLPFIEESKLEDLKTALSYRYSVPKDLLKEVKQGERYATI